MHDRITCFLGAGAAVEIGGPTTLNLTKAVVDGWKTEKTQELVKVVTAFQDKEWNFEQLLHILETLYNISPDKADAFRNPISLLPLLAERKLVWSHVTVGAILSAIRSLFDSIGDSIYAYSRSECFQKKENQWFRKFWKDLSCRSRLDIINLNYDTCLEQSIDDYEDGFTEKVKIGENLSKEAYRFHPLDLHGTNKHRLMHLHGCINYGFESTDDLNRFAFQDAFHDLFRYSDYRQAKEHWSGRSYPDAQTGEMIVAGPLITGLRKTDKITFHPYDTYECEFQNALMRNKSLLVIGYSCGDIHLNRILARLHELHGDRRRVVWIDYFPKDEKGKIANWNRDAELRDIPSENTYPTASPLFGEDLSGINMLNRLRLPDEGCLFSKDGCARFYFHGFSETVKQHGNEIIEFLS